MSGLDDELLNQIKRVYQPEEAGLSESEFIDGVTGLVGQRRRRQRLAAGLIMAAAVCGSVMASQVEESELGHSGDRLEAVTQSSQVGLDETDLELVEVYQVWSEAAGGLESDVLFTEIDSSSSAEQGIEADWSPELAAISDLIDVTDI